MAPTYSNGQEMVSIYLIKIKITTKFFKSVCMSNIPKIKTIIRPCKTNIKMAEVLDLNTNVLGHFGMFGQYSKHPNHTSTVQDMCIQTACRTSRLAGS